MIAKMVEEQLDTLDNHITWASIANALNLTPSALSHFKKKGTELNFDSLLTLGKLVFKGNYLNIVSDWCLTLRKPSNLRMAFEFLSLNRKKEHLRTILHRESTSSSKTMIELLVPYRYLLKHLEGSFDPSHIADLEQDTNKIKSTEAKVSFEFTRFYFYHRINNISEMEISYLNAKKLIDDIEEGLLKEMFNIRMCEAASILSLFIKGDSLQSRGHSETIIKNKAIICAGLIGDAYYRLGMSYLYESPDICLAYLEKAKKSFQLDNSLVYKAKEIEDNDASFAKIYWGLTEYGALNDDSSRAFYLVSKGENSKALEIIKNLNPDSPFTRFYEGVATDNPDKLIESLLIFKKAKNLFYAKLPIDALNKYKEKTGIVKLILE